MPPDPALLAETRSWLVKASKDLATARSVWEAIVARLPPEART